MRFLVVRKDIKSSECWPVIVEAEPDTPADQIVRRAFDMNGWHGYEPIGKSYYVVPAEEAVIVSYRPKRNYEIVVEAV